MVDDTHQDERFHDNPLVTGPPHVRAYAGVPIVSPDGFAIGVLCVQDQRPRSFSELDLTPLHDLAQMVTDELELRLAHRELAWATEHDEDHQLAGVAGSCMDLSEQEAERERYRLAQEAARFGIWEWNLEHDSVHWDEACWRMLGYDPAEGRTLAFADWRDLVHPDDLARVEPVVIAQVRRSEPFTIEFRYKCADGAWLWVQGRGHIVKRAPDGQPQLLMGTHVEIEQLKQTEHALRLREQELQQAAITSRK
ncbi:GAF domain-containing protein [Halorhodospira halochloris]|uniref:GAF domain-containing protein n=1 Tax=Halorhodospira halochloris TaxID=1052 RepID=UPI002379EBC2|nr:PAS domain-containing protein [Halorhodospira halochloris]